MNGTTRAEQFLRELRGRIDAWQKPPEARRLDCPDPPPLYSDLPGSPEACTVELLRPEGPRPFRVRVLPGKREGLPLLVISPGYGGSLRDIPAEAAEHFTSMFISPLGYGLADGASQMELREHGIWPVLPNTVFGEPEGYADWLLDAAWAIRWVRSTGGAGAGMIFAGCSQGGAMSILLGSLFRDSCLAVCADEPFLVDCSGDRIHDFIETVTHDPYQIVSLTRARENLQTVDPLCHAPQLAGLPVLIVSGSTDRQCPDVYNRSLYAALPEDPRNRYVLCEGRPHGYSSRFHRHMMDFLGTVLAKDPPG